jgi:hypothetical protein
MVLGLCQATHDVAVVVQVTDEDVGLLQQRHRVAWPLGQARDDAVAVDVALESGAAASFDPGDAVALHQRQHTEDLAGGVLMPALLDAFTQQADVFARDARPLHQLVDLRCGTWTPVSRIDAEEAVLGAKVFA